MNIFKHIKNVSQPINLLEGRGENFKSANQLGQIYSMQRALAARGVEPEKDTFKKAHLKVC